MVAVFQKSCDAQKTSREVLIDRHRETFSDDARKKISREPLTREGSFR